MNCEKIEQNKTENKLEEMEHHRLYNNPPLHWGYSSSPHTIHNTWVPPPSRGVKRSISESDCDDNYSETSSKE